jgi:hypothetical protein
MQSRTIHEPMARDAELNIRRLLWPDKANIHPRNPPYDLVVTASRPSLFAFALLAHNLHQLLIHMLQKAKIHV